MENITVQKSVQRDNMQIYGHELIDFEYLYSVQNEAEIDEVDEECLLFFEYEPKLIKYCKDKKRQFSLHVFNETEAVIGNGAGAKLLVCPKKIASQVQNLAEYYLFDAKVGILVNGEEEIALALEKRVDVAILPGAIL